jgi:hypothetical protein
MSFIYYIFDLIITFAPYLILMVLLCFHKGQKIIKGALNYEWVRVLELSQIKGSKTN